MLFPFIEVMSDFKKRMLEIFGMPVGVGVGVFAAVLVGLMIATKETSRTQVEQVDCECTCRASECVAFRKPGDLPRCSGCRCSG